MNKYLIFVALFVVLLCTDAQRISDSLNAFSIDLLSTTLHDSQISPNLALAPYSVWTLLTIIAEGARNHTAEQLEKTLRIPNRWNKEGFRRDFSNMYYTLTNKDPDLHLDMYNSIFTTAEQKLNPEFQNVSRRSYRVNVQPIDFRNTREAADTMNRYVAQATKNKIRDFIMENDVRDAQIFALNALYFKGAWMTPFNRSRTNPDTFYDENNQPIGNVDMMFHMGFFPYTRLDDIRAHAVELPYGRGDKMSMILILPYKDESLSDLLKAMQNYPFSKIMDLLDIAKEEFEDEDVKVYLPRFNIVSDLNLNGVLAHMGIMDLFDSEKADLLGMFPHLLHVSQLLHRVHIDVNEEGTVAAAASGAGLVNKSQPPKFQANKPFLYFIVNKPTKSIIFAGKVAKPPIATTVRSRNAFS